MSQNNLEDLGGTGTKTTHEYKALLFTPTNRFSSTGCWFRQRTLPVQSCINVSARPAHLLLQRPFGSSHAPAVRLHLVHCVFCNTSTWPPTEPVHTECGSAASPLVGRVPLCNRLLSLQEYGVRMSFVPNLNDPLVHGGHANTICRTRSLSPIDIIQILIASL